MSFFKKSFVFLCMMFVLVACAPKAIQKRTLAVWDFDGTIIKGDCSEGLKISEKTLYRGLIAESILAGFSKDYQGEDGVRRFFESYDGKLATGDKKGAYADVAKLFVGQDRKKIEAFAKHFFETEYHKYYYRESVEEWKKLEKQGVENHIISASLEVFVRAAAETLDIEKNYIHGVRIEEKDGKLTDKIEKPFPFGDGKTQIMKQIEKERNGKALYGFGNSYSTDSAFLMQIVKQGGTAVMINGGDKNPDMAKYFICRNQDETFENK